MPCERMYLRCLFVSQVWRRRSRICNETHTPSGTSTPQEEPCHSTIHTRSSGNSSARVKCFSTIPTPKSVSTRRRVPRRATIRIRSSGSLSDPTRPTRALTTRKLLSAINTYLTDLARYSISASTSASTQFPFAMPGGSQITLDVDSLSTSRSGVLSLNRHFLLRLACSSLPSGSGQDGNEPPSSGWIEVRGEEQDTELRLTSQGHAIANLSIRNAGTVGLRLPAKPADPFGISRPAKPSS